MSPEVWINLGSNLGDRADYIRYGLKRIGEIGEIGKVSSVYETEPWGDPDQPDYLNAVCCIISELDNPLVLLEYIKEIEAATGRERNDERWSSRPLDLDILFWGMSIYSLENLIIPHPLLELRKFVLVPLAEVAPDFIHPIHNVRIRELLRNCPDAGEVRFWGTVDIEEDYNLKNKGM